MGDIDDSDFDVICTTNELGRNLTRRVATETVDSKWGSPTATSNADTSVVGIVIPVNDEDIIKLQGRVKSGDARCYFKQDETMNNDNLIIDGSVTYRVENIRTMNAGSNSVFKKCLLIRIT